MDDDISKGLGALGGLLSPRQELIEQERARREVARRLGVDKIPNPDEITPPGLLIYIYISFFGSSASKNKSCAIIKLLT